MPTHRWKYVGSDTNADIYVDYRTHHTKVITPRYIYIYKGMYPYVQWDTRTKYTR